MKKDNKNIRMDPLKPTINGSLAHLAYGHLAFRAWRKLKTSENKKNE